MRRSSRWTNQSQPKNVHRQSFRPIPDFLTIRSCRRTCCSVADRQLLPGVAWRILGISVHVAAQLPNIAGAHRADLQFFSSTTMIAGMPRWYNAVSGKLTRYESLSTRFFKACVWKISAAILRRHSTGSARRGWAAQRKPRGLCDGG